MGDFIVDEEISYKSLRKIQQTEKSSSVLTNINPEFLLYVLNSKVEVWNRSLLTTGSVSDNLSAENVGSYIIPFPNLDEQERIVSYLNEELNELDKLSDKVENQIEKLKEYRQSLIYEAVTGKIDLRDMELDEVR